MAEALLEFSELIEEYQALIAVLFALAFVAAITYTGLAIKDQTDYFRECDRTEVKP